MLRKILMVACPLAVAIVCFCSYKNGSDLTSAAKPKTPAPQKARQPDYRNYYGISWRGTAHDNLTYARNMKYDYVFYQAGMENDTLSNGLYFYLESPEYCTYNRTFKTNVPYPAGMQEYFQSHYVLKSATQPFPGNIATGWYFNATSFTPVLDYQQQAVISYTVDSIMRYVKKIETKNPKFKFGGFAWDVPQPAGDFWDTTQTSGGHQITLQNWMGADKGAVYPGRKHDFATYSDGHVAFYRQLYAQARKLNPNAKFIMEPYHVYKEWMSLIQANPAWADVMPDMLSQESAGTEFDTDTRLFNGNYITKDKTGSSSPNSPDEAENRTIAATAAINGSWFNWFGRFGGSGKMPNYLNVGEVPPRLRMIRLLPGYENLNNIPLKQRSWDGSTYQSPTAYAYSGGIAFMQPGTNKYYVILHHQYAHLPLPKGRTVAGIQKTNLLFAEIGDGSAELAIKEGQISPADINSISKVYVVTLNP